MHNIIKDKAIVADDWHLLKLDASDTPETVRVAAGKQIVPLKVWLAQKSTLQTRTDIGVWIASDERPEELKDDVASLPLIAVDFPVFSDGRGYSIAYNLRARLKFTGELRAVGDVLRDQLFYLQRVGFNAFATRADRSMEDPVDALITGIEGSDLQMPGTVFGERARLSGRTEGPVVPCELFRKSQAFDPRTARCQHQSERQIAPRRRDHGLLRAHIRSRKACPPKPRAHCTFDRSPHHRVEPRGKKNLDSRQHRGRGARAAAHRGFELIRRSRARLEHPGEHRLQRRQQRRLPQPNAPRRPVVEPRIHRSVGEACPARNSQHRRGIPPGISDYFDRGSF